MERITIMLFIVSFFFIFTSIVSDIFVYKRLKRNSLKIAKYHKWNSILCTLFMFIAFIIFSFNTEALLELKYVIYIFLLISAPKLLMLLLWGSTLLIGFFTKKKIGQPLFYGYMVLNIGLFLLLLHGGIIGRFDLTIERSTIYSKRLPPSFDGLRIVQLSDMHLGHFIGNEKFIKRVVDSVNALSPDLILQTGDIVSYTAQEIESFIPILSKLKAKYGIYAILGNHDYGDYVHWNNPKEKRDNDHKLIDLQEKMGWTLLNNNHHIIYNKQGDSLLIVGVENWENPSFPRYGDLKEALYKAPIEKTFTLLLTHDPEHWDAEVVTKYPIDLTFSGHTHAAQFQIGNFSPSAFKYEEWSGLYKKGKQYLYVNRGLGTIMFPMRIGSATPEITLLTVNSKKH